MPRLDAIVGSHRHHAAKAQRFGLGQELVQLTIGPSAAKEEHDGRSLVGRLPLVGIMHLQPQFPLLGLFVHERSRKRGGGGLVRPDKGHHE